jgi:hypothetical protein
MGYSSWKTSTIATLYQHGVSDAVDVNTMVACPTQSEYEAIVAKEAAGTALLASEEHKKKLHYANRIVAPAILAAMTNDATGSALCSNSMSSDYPAGKAWLMMKDLAERHQPSSTTAKTDCKTLVRKIDCDLDDTPVMEMHDEFIKTNAKFDVAARTSDSDFLEMMLEKCKDTGYAKILRDEIGKTSPNLLNAAKEIKSLQDPILNARGKKKGNYKNNGDKEFNSLIVRRTSPISLTIRPRRAMARKTRTRVMITAASVANLATIVRTAGKRILRRLQRGTGREKKRRRIRKRPMHTLIISRSH